MNVCEHLLRNAAAFGDKRALVEPSGRERSFKELLRSSQRLAAGLHRSGLRPGDPVLLLLPMSIPLYESLLALFHGGQPAVLADPRSVDFAQLARRLELRGVIGTPTAHLLRLWVPALRRAPVQISTGFVPLPHLRLERLYGDDALPMAEVPDLQPALVTLTTGSTGAPRALGRTHAFLDAQRAVLTRHLGLEPDDIDLPTLPVFLLASLAAGATCVLPDADLRNVGAVDPARVIAQLQSWRCTSTSGSPAFFAPIARTLRERGERLPHLRKIFLGGARVRTSVLRDLQLVAPQARIEVIYGSTEAEPIAAIGAREVLEDTAAREAAGAGTCVGRPVAGMRVHIASNAGPGEVLVAGPNVSAGYYRDPDADAASKWVEHGVRWHRTGDCGYFDSNRRLWLVGRAGETVQGLHPYPVESVAESLEFVERAALVEEDGAPVLACSLRSEPRGWREALRERTGITRVVRLPRIPVDRRHNSKIDRAATRRAVRAAG